VGTIWHDGEEDTTLHYIGEWAVGDEGNEFESMIDEYQGK
jgi:hypothetical protein